MSPLVVSSGGTITITGSDFAVTCSNGCQVIATPAGATTGTDLTSDFVEQYIDYGDSARYLDRLYHASRSNAVPGSDCIGIMAASAESVYHRRRAGKSAIRLHNGRNGAFGAIDPDHATAAAEHSPGPPPASASWLSVSPASGTAPSTLIVSVSPASLSAGTYSGNVQIVSSGASNTPLSVAVTLTVTQPAGGAVGGAAVA